MRRLPRIALTSGEPAGVGPDLCLALAAAQRGAAPLSAAPSGAAPLSADPSGAAQLPLDLPPCEIVCLADERLLAERARLLHLDLAWQRYAPAGAPAASGGFQVLDVPLAVRSEPGRLDTRNAHAVLAMLDRAADGCLAGEFDAMVTAPVQKSCLLDAGIAFTGHTEYLAERTAAPRPVMMLASGALRVALATTHLPLAAVSGAITIDSLCEVLEILDHDLRRRWHLPAPRIAVCGLNPHAGESGHLGDEEVRVIAPALERMRARGVQADGPLPADTVFVPRLLARHDAVLAMYHDQGLPVIKHAGFDSAVNVTLGLPIVRTSVDHGTALDLAGTGRADARSLAAAVRLAVELAAPGRPAR